MRRIRLTIKEEYSPAHVDLQLMSKDPHWSHFLSLATGDEVEDDVMLQEVVLAYGKLGACYFSSVATF